MPLNAPLHCDPNLLTLSQRWAWDGRGTVYAFIIYYGVAPVCPSISRSTQKVLQCNMCMKLGGKVDDGPAMKC